VGDRALREADGKFLYDFYAGNGQQIQGGTLDMQTGGNLHGAAIAGARLSFQFNGGAADGLMVGVNGLPTRSTTIEPPTPPSSDST